MDVSWIGYVAAVAGVFAIIIAIVDFLYRKKTGRWL